MSQQPGEGDEVEVVIRGVVAKTDGSEWVTLGDDRCYWIAGNNESVRVIRRKPIQAVIGPGTVIEHTSRSMTTSGVASTVRFRIPDDATDIRVSQSLD